MTAAVHLAHGDLVDGRYRIESVLGVGGAGAVYAACDEGATEEEARNVAIKVLAASDGFADEHRAGLELEFSLLARLNHPNVVSALAIGTTSDGRPYLVEELVLGPTLDQARHRLQPSDYFSIAHGVLEGLAHIHRRGWVHHDIKPANILIANVSDTTAPSQWIPKIADLGVASLRDSDPQGSVSGTIPFLSPERLVGQLADPRSDVWALGMSLLFCITGTLPIEVGSVREAARLLARAPLPALRDLRADVPSELELVVGRMLTRDGRSRYRDGSDALAGLRREMARAKMAVPALPAATLAQSPALIGRDEILAEALARLENTRSRLARVIAIRGERGSGRTRLLREIALEVQLRGARAIFIDAGVGVAPWRRALAGLGVYLTTNSVEAVAGALLDAIGSLSVVFLIDDVDARDGVAMRLLHRLRSALGSADTLAGVVVAGDLASDWSDENPHELTLQLAPLSNSDIEALIKSALGDNVGPQALLRLRNASMGNVARAVAVMTNAVRSGSLESVGGTWSLSANVDTDSFGTDDTPHREAIRELGATTRTLVVALAVLGPCGAPVELELARDVVDADRQRFFAMVSALCQLGLASVRGTGDPFSSSVALSGRVDRLALEGREPELIRQFHERAWQIQRARGETDSAVLARHAWGAKLDVEAAKLTCDAAARALARGDYAKVLGLTDHIDDSRLDAVAAGLPRRIRIARADALVELSRPLDGAKLAAQVLAAHPEQLRAAHVVVRAAIAAGDATRAERALEVVTDVTGRVAATELDEVELATLRVEVARVNRRVEEVRTAAAAATIRIDATAANPVDEAERIRHERARGRVKTALGAALTLGGDPSTGTPVLEVALKHFVDIGDHARIAEVSAFLAAGADLVGDGRRRDGHLRQGLESAERAGADSAAARLLNVRGLSLLWRGRTDEAAEAFEEAERRARGPGLYRVVSAVSGNLVVVHRRAGHYGSALEAARRSLRVKHPLGDRAGVVATTLNLADVYLDLGANRLAAAAAARVVRESHKHGNRRVEINGRVTLAMARSAMGAVSQAQAALAPVSAELEDAEYQSELEVRLAVVTVQAPRRALSRAADLYRSIERKAMERQEPFIAASAAYRRGVLLAECGAADLRRAIEGASQCSARHLLWRARAQLGLLCSQQGDDVVAGAEFARASESFEAVLANVPDRFRHTYVIADGREQLIEAMNMSARFRPPENPLASGGASVEEVADTVLKVASELALTTSRPASRGEDLETRDLGHPTASTAGTEGGSDTMKESVGELETLLANDSSDQE